MQSHLSQHFISNANSHFFLSDLRVHLCFDGVVMVFEETFHFCSTALITSCLSNRCNEGSNPKVYGLCVFKFFTTPASQSLSLFFVYAIQ